MAPCIGRRCVARAGGARGIGVGGAWARQRETLTTQRLGRATAGRVQLAKLLERQKKTLGLGLCVAASAQSEKDETGATGEGDVYLVDTKPLSEGVKKHTVLIFVTDESGIINRVSGVFSRRGYNIESLAVGLNIDKALFTVVVNTTTADMTNLVKQLAKLVKVKYVENVTFQDRLDRELMLIKVKAESAADKTEIIQTAGIFRAKVVDVGETSVTLSSAGDPGKGVALQRNLQKFGVMEVARTGKISLKRGLSTIQDSVGEKKVNRSNNQTATASVDDENFNLEEGIALNESPADSYAEEANDESGMGDVYMLDEDVSVGIWEVGYLPGERDEKNAVEEEDGGEVVERHTVSVLVQDQPGVLQEVTSVFARRGYNMQSLAVGYAEEKGLSRISLVVPGTKSSIVNLGKQLEKLVYVKSVEDLTEVPHNSRELMLIKCRCSLEQRREIIDLCEIFRSKICDISKETMTLEIEGSLDKMAAFQKMLANYEILEVARTGRIALSRGSGVDSRFLERREGSSYV